MSNIFKCKRCRDTFIQEEFDGHACTPNLKHLTELEFDYYYISKKNGNESITIKSMDGTLFEFVKRLRLPSDKVSISDESLQGEKYHRTDVDLTEPKT